MSKTIFIFILPLIILGVLYSFSNNEPDTFDNNLQSRVDSNIVPENSEIRDGVQYITINARGGYSPRKSTAKSDIPTKLIVKTNGTYDCSASLVIPSVNFRKILPNTGETVIDIGTKKAGDFLQGLCGMGMYSFLINFI